MANAYRRTYKDRDGRKRKVRTYTVDWCDANGAWQRLTTKYTDKQAAEDMGNRLERESAQGLEGRRDLYAESKARPLAEHVADHWADLEAMGRAEKYIDNGRRRLAKLARECGWTCLDDLTADSFVRWRTATKGKRQGATTLNQYLDTARAFLAWCVRHKRIRDNALAAVGKLDVSRDVRRKRRALSVDQLRRLLDVAPAARAQVYLTAVYTGLRRAELAALRWGDVRLMATTPYIQLRAEATKAHRADRVPLRGELADALRQARPANATDIAPVFTDMPTMPNYRADLRAAGIPYKDAQGRQADFHALRHTFGTMLAQSGTGVRTSMELMRHTDVKLTMGVYCDPHLLATASAVENLPTLTGPGADADGAEALATGTDDRGVADDGRLSVILSEGIDSQGPDTSHDGTGEGGDRGRHRADTRGAAWATKPLKTRGSGASRPAMAHAGAEQNPTTKAGSGNMGPVGFEPTTHGL